MEGQQALSSKVMLSDLLSIVGIHLALEYLILAVQIKLLN